MSEICPRCGSLSANSSTRPCEECADEISKMRRSAAVTTITCAEYDRLRAVEAEYQRVSALVLGICESAMKAVGSDSYEVQRLRAAVKQIAELMPAAIARAKGEK